ncbi:MAG: hypothetical protein U1F76_17075 [Candidatus Competibacteraceae bacterium]
MTVKLWRRENLLTLLGEYSRKEFCERTGLATTYISQFIARQQDIDDTTARQVEAGLKLPRGWMDVSHATRSSGVPVAPVEAGAEGLPVEERILVAKFRQLDPADQIHVRAVIDAFLAARRTRSS